MCCTKFQVIWVKQITFIAVFLTLTKKPLLLFKSSEKPAWYRVKNFAKFTRKHLCQSLFLNKVTGLRLAALLKKRLWEMCFPVNFVKLLKTPFFIEYFWWLLLKAVIVQVQTPEGLHGQIQVNIWCHYCFQYIAFLKMENFGVKPVFFY